MGLYKRKGSPYYWMTFRVKGRRKSESTKTANKKLAEKIYAKRVTEIAEGRFFNNEARKRTFEELRDKYMVDYSKPNKAESSHVRDQSLFRNLSRFFAGYVLADISAAMISDYKSLRRRDGAKPATLARELEVFRHALNLATKEWEWMEINPFWKVRIEKPDNKVERWLTAEEEERLLDASPEWLQGLIVFALNTGMRQGEVLSLKWSQVDLKRRTATLLHTKNKQVRTVPLNRTVTELLGKKGRVRYISGYVFTSHAGTKLDARNLLRSFYNARKEADLEDFRWHDLRHTFGTRLVQAGIDLYTVKELMGHKTIIMTMRYAHHNTESIRHGVDVLDTNGYNMVTFNKKGLSHN